MPQLRVLTWNANGESQEKATLLHQVLGHLERAMGWQPDVLLIQEAGDLNVRQAAIHERIELGDGSHFEVLARWRGFGQGLDYVAVPPAFVGRVVNGFHYDGAPSDHSIVGATLVVG